MTGAWPGGEPGRELGGEPGTPPGLRPPEPGSEPGDQLPGPYGGPPGDGGLPGVEPGGHDGEPGDGRLPSGEPGVPDEPGVPQEPGAPREHGIPDGREAPREQPDRAGTGGGRGSGPWRPPARRGRDGGKPDGGRADGGADGNSGAKAPGDRPDDDAPEPPEDIHTAWVLWLAATAFALLGMWLNVLTSSLSDLPADTRDTFRDTVTDAGLDESGLDGMFTGVMVFGGVLALAAAAVTVWLVFRLRAGRPWARTLLNIVAIFLVVDAVAVLIGVFSGTVATGSRGEVFTFIVMALQILAGLCAAVAVWRQHTAEAMTYLTGGGRDRD